MRIEYWLVGAAGIGVAGYGLSYLLKLNRLSNELESETKVSIHKVSLTGIELDIKVKLKNPSGGTVKVKHPFVKVIYEQKTVASSQVKDVNIAIPKFSEVNMEPIRIKLGFISLATTVPSMIKAYRQTGKMNLTVQTISTINDRLPYTKTDRVTLGGGKQT